MAKLLWDRATAIAMARIGGRAEKRSKSVQYAINRMSTGEHIKNETLKKLITPTPEETALGIMQKDKADLLKKLGIERNPMFLTLDKIQYTYGLRLLIAEYYLSYLAKMNVLLNPVGADGKPRTLTQEETVRLERNLDYDRRRIFDMSLEAGIFLFGKEATTMFNLQQITQKLSIKEIQDNVMLKFETEKSLKNGNEKLVQNEQEI